MTRRAYRTAARKRQDRMYDMLVGEPLVVSPATLPTLLASALALITERPGRQHWDAGQLVSLDGEYTLKRVYRARLLAPTDLICLFAGQGAGFPVAQWAGDHYAPMTDVAGFTAWLQAVKEVVSGGVYAIPH